MTINLIKINNYNELNKKYIPREVSRIIDEQMLNLSQKKKDKQMLKHDVISIVKLNQVACAPGKLLDCESLVLTEVFIYIVSSTPSLGPKALRSSVMSKYL